MKLVTVIIPVYNGERYIKDCLDSVLKQTYKNLEIIVINDGSTDGTLSILEFYKKNNKNIIIIDQKNSGQGVARNRGIKITKGEYVAFIDADDFIHENFIDSLYNVAKEYNADFSMSDWIYYDHNSKKYRYASSEQFMGYQKLEGKNTEIILAAKIYFTVNKLYKTKFLRENDILYGEGYIYEDYEFYIKAATLANTIATVPNPYYIVRINEDSTTKTNYNSLKHYNAFLQAIDISLKDLSYKNMETPTYIYLYFFSRLKHYHKNRIPEKYKKSFVKETFNILNKYNYSLTISQWVNKTRLKELQFYLKHNYVSLFILKYRDYLLKKPLKSFYKNIKKVIRTNPIKLSKIIYYKINLQLPFIPKQILFLGFDYNYVGNSKVFFEYLLNTNLYKMKFVTNSFDVSNKYKIKPYSFKYYKYLARSHNLVLETWVPLWIEKRVGSNWIQLWHGTPIKKMLFDSHESQFVLNKLNFKLNKYKDISKWDYFICENEISKQIFKDAFLLDDSKIKVFGYPRNEYLKQNKNNVDKILEIKEELNIPLNKKIVFYAPTWRDYNHDVQEKDLKYLLDLKYLSNNLGDEYIVLQRKHDFSLDNIEQDSIITIYDEVDTHDLLLITDVLITDYSSIVFDFMYLDKPFYIYANDYDKYKKSRGVYDIIYKEFANVTTSDIDSIKNYIVINYLLKQTIINKYHSKENVNKELIKLLK